MRGRVRVAAKIKNGVAMGEMDKAERRKGNGSLFVGLRKGIQREEQQQILIIRQQSARVKKHAFLQEEATLKMTAGMLQQKGLRIWRELQGWGLVNVFFSKLHSEL